MSESAAGTRRAEAAGERLIRAVDALRRGRPERALRLLERRFAAAARGAAPARRGELWRLRGHVLRGVQRSRAAADAYRRAQRWYRHAGEAREQGRCAIGLVDSLMYLGRYAEARRAADAGRRLLARAGDRAALARLLNNEANLHHRLDAPGRALQRYREARRALARAGDAAGAALIEGNLANCLSLLGRMREARRLYRRARRAHARRGHLLDALTADYNLAYLDFLEHRHEPALDALADVRERALAQGSPAPAALAALDRAEILLRLGDSEAALVEAASAAQECAALGMGYEQAKAETFAALGEFRLGRIASARARLDRSLGAFDAEGNPVWVGEALVGLATIARQEGSPRAAAALLAAARGRFAFAADLEREGCCLALLVRARLECGEAPAAQGLLEELRGRARRRPTPRLRHLALAAEAAASRARGDRAGARRGLRRAARAAERLAARILDEQWRASFWGEWGWAHRELAALELAEGRVGAALEALEAGRGRALVGSATTRRRGRLDTLPGGVRAWAASHQARERERASRALAPSAEAPAPRARNAFAATPRLRRALQSAVPRAIRAQALRRGLPSDALLLDYLLHDGALGAITVRRSGLGGRQDLVSELKLGRLVHGVLFGLRSAAFAPSAERPADLALEQDLTELASLILWPLVGGAEPPRALAVVPVGPLGRLPWAALPLPDGRALCEACELTVVPGLRLGLARAGGREPAAGVPLVVAADPGELEHVAPETRAVLEAFPEARLLGGRAATAERFLALAPRAPWIHFAGHGHYRPDAPHESGLRFMDRWVTAGELANRRLRSRWMTLSACQSARALVRPGEEWFGLARSLLLAGAGAVLAAQWDTDDAAAARLMAEVYARLGAGVGPVAALGSAQAARRAQGAHPLDWAGFVALGGPGGAAGAGAGVSKGGLGRAVSEGLPA